MVITFDQLTRRWCKESGGHENDSAYGLSLGLHISIGLWLLIACLARWWIE